MKNHSKCLGDVLRAAATLGAFALIGIAILVTVDVATRRLTGHPITGVFEVTSVLLVMATFLPLGLVLFHNEQLHVDIIFEAVKGRAAFAFKVLDVAVGLAVFGILLWITTKEFHKAYEGRFLLSGMIQIPTWIPLAMIWTGTALVIVTLVFQGADYMRRLLSRRDDTPGSANDIPEARP